jgi:ribonuclease-3
LTTRHDIAAPAPKKPETRPSQDALPDPAKPSNGPKGDVPSGSRRRTKPAAEEADAPHTFFGYRFNDPALLSLALTHSSLAYELGPEAAGDPRADNEQLEFVGDAVLGLLVAEALYRRFPACCEGELTRMRASLVSSRNLAEVAQRLELGKRLRLGRGEAHSGGQRKPALLANALEAVIAAIYLDGGLPPARDFVLRHIVAPAEASLSGLAHSPETFAGAIGDYKSALQERLQATGGGQPQYVVTDQSGPDHQKRFRIEVRIADARSGTGYRILGDAEGTTKKQAQQAAARLAYTALLTSPVPSGGVDAQEAAP